MNTSVQELASAGILKIEGGFNDIESKGIIEIVNALLDKDLVNLIMNFKDCSEINNYGISVLISLIGAINEKEGKLVFTNISNDMEKKFNMMGIASYVKFFDDDVLALKSFDDNF